MMAAATGPKKEKATDEADDALLDSLMEELDEHVKGVAR